MRLYWRLTLMIAAISFLAESVQANEGNAALSLVDRAIAAMGGRTKLARFKAYTFEAKGTLYVKGKESPLSSDGAAQLPGQIKVTHNGVVTALVNRNKGWFVAESKTHEMTEDELTVYQEQLYEDWVTLLLPLNEKGFDLFLLRESEVNGRRALGVKVSQKGRQDVDLFFDKQHGLLVKTQRVVHSLEGKEVKQETFLENYKDVDGVKIPMKTTRLVDGKKYGMTEVVKVQPVGNLPETLFNPPSQGLPNPTVRSANRRRE